jgi:hypothetical protein
LKKAALFNEVLAAAAPPGEPSEAGETVEPAEAGEAGETAEAGEEEGEATAEEPESDGAETPAAKPKKSKAKS